MPTGSTPLLLYRELVALKLNWRRVVTFNLDEYVGLGPEHPQSYARFMWENLFRHVNIPRKNAHIPDGLAKDIPKFCARYERQIRRAGGIDLQVLGIGTIMEARQVLLLAFGQNKAAAVAAAVGGPITAMCPASILQMHPVVKIVLDEAAAARLQKTEYYRWVYDNKPDWQRF